MFGALLAVLSAATFGFNNASVRRGVLTGTVSQALAITVPLGLPLFIIPAFFMGQLDDIGGITLFQWETLGMAGVLHFVWGRYCNYRAVQAMGSNLAGTVMQVQLLIALVLAMVFLGEVLTPLKMLGIALVIAGPPIMLSGRRGKAGAEPKVEGPKGFEPDYVTGSVFALLAATGYGASPVLVSAGLKGMQGIGAGVLGGFVSYAVSTVVVVLFFMVRPSEFRHALAVDRIAGKWFLISGVAVWLSQFFRYLALGIAPVTVVQPIQQLSLIFRMLFGWFLNREYEVFDVRAMVGILVSFIGAILLASSTEILNGWIVLPDAWREILAWHWP
jgi:drug/metabolite transporter (DMT)-like permease